jgi:predicted nucleic acid-binding protein
MMDDLPVYVLDSFAVLAHFEDETGTGDVIDVLNEALAGKCRVLLSAINLGEILYIIERERGIRSAHEALGGIDQLPIEILPTSREAVLEAAHVKANHRVSYADAFAIAAAVKYKGSVLTGDPAFKEVEKLIEIK